MTKVTVTAVGTGTIPGDGSGDAAYVGGDTFNTNDTDLATAINDLAAATWTREDTSASMSMGDKWYSNSQAGNITYALPDSSGSPATDDYNSVVILNADYNGNDITASAFASDVIIPADGGASVGSIVLKPGEMALFFHVVSTFWVVHKVIYGNDSVENLTDATITSVATGEVFVWNGSAWVNQTLEEADIVDRAEPAIEATPYMFHTSHGSVASGTEDIVCADEPSSDITITGDNVTINLDVPALTLPERGLADVKLCGKVFVHIDGTARAGLTATTDATASVIKGDEPASANEDAILAWEWYDNGTTDFLWAEWINDA